jgi:small conductance mechanosensitive channel
MTLPLVPAQTGATTDPTGFVQSFIESLGVGASLAAPIAAAVVFIVVFVAIYLLGRVLVTPLFGRFLDRRDLDEHAKRPLKKVVGGIIVFIAIGIAFGLAGFGSILQSLATVAAAATLAIGFAMQDVIANFVAGVFIYTDKPFRIGDWIEWDDQSGIVEDISLRVTRVRTFDNELLTVPNSTLTDGVIKNPVAKDKLRMKFVFGIGYEDDIEQATDIILEEAEKHDDILDDPEPSVRLTELADSYVGLQSRFWIANPSRADFVRTRGEYVTDVKQRFDENDINIPYPQVDLSGGIEMAGPVAEAMAKGDD